VTTLPALSHSDIEIQTILTGAKVIAVVGASPKPWRDSGSIMRLLMDAGYMVIPVNPNYREIFGERCYPDLRAVPFPIDIVNIFRRFDELMPIIDDAIAVNTKTIWMQFDVMNEAAAGKALQAGLKVVMNLCIAVEYKRLNISITK
jgi:predicted CoA-binding protein